MNLVTNNGLYELKMSKDDFIKLQQAIDNAIEFSEDATMHDCDFSADEYSDICKQHEANKAIKAVLDGAPSTPTSFSVAETFIKAVGADLDPVWWEVSTVDIYEDEASEVLEAIQRHGDFLSWLRNEATKKQWDRFIAYADNEARHNQKSKNYDAWSEIEKMLDGQHN